MENYKTYLSTLGVTPIEMRLITKNELEELRDDNIEGMDDLMDAIYDRIKL